MKTVLEKTETAPPPTRVIKVALAGNPNCGKTTIFNNLTGSRQKVGNYPGVTVESKRGLLRHGTREIEIVDLPGMYSLSSWSIEEIAARDFVLREQPDIIVNILDSTNLERHLYLTLQLLELGAPMIVVLNMADELKTRALHIDTEKLYRLLGAPIVLSVGHRNHGTRAISERVLEIINYLAETTPPVLPFSRELESELAHLAELLPAPAAPVTRRWLALQMLESDPPTPLRPDLENSSTAALELSRRRIRESCHEEPAAVIAEQRFGQAHAIAGQVLRRTERPRRTSSERIDAVLTHRLLGLPIFAGLMYLTFWLVFAVGHHPVGWLEAGLAGLTRGLNMIWPAEVLPLAHSLVFDGIIAGVGNVLIFLPNILLLFFAIALLEDTGYMGRAAFLTDRLMNLVGLHGKSFIPMLIGFGCTVPAIMATRVLENRRDRLTTILILPLMSCGARLPIYLLIAPAFFAGRAPQAVFAMYIIGILLAVIAARGLRSTMFRGADSIFVLELPPYRLPTLKALALHMWQRGWLYLRKAGTVILGISIIMWGLTNLPRPSAAQLAGLPPAQVAQFRTGSSLAGRLGHFLEPALRPLGFDWKIGTALIGACSAKEVFVAQMGIMHAVSDDPGTQRSQITLQKHLQADYAPLTGFCVMLFCLVAAPCMATLATTRKETGSWGWAIGQWCGLTLLAWLLTLAVNQTGPLFWGG